MDITRESEFSLVSDEPELEITTGVLGDYAATRTRRYNAEIAAHDPDVATDILVNLTHVDRPLRFHMGILHHTGNGYIGNVMHDDDESSHWSHKRARKGLGK